jgi:hypothetical protein
MPAAAKSSKAKHPYHTDHAHEERVQASKLDVKEYNIPKHTAACLHQVRLNCTHCQLTSFQIIRFLMEHCGIACMDVCTRGVHMRSSRSFPNHKRQHLCNGLATRLLLQSPSTETTSLPLHLTLVVLLWAQIGSTALSSATLRSAHPSLGTLIRSVLKTSI